jgi:hypothetical protein
VISNSAEKKKLNIRNRLGGRSVKKKGRWDGACNRSHAAG